MTMWKYVPDRRVTLKERRKLPDTLTCLCEQAEWHRVAERFGKPDYQWVPSGYICTGCNTMWLGVP